MSKSIGRPGSFNALIHEQIKELGEGQQIQISKKGAGKARVLEAVAVSASVTGHKLSHRIAADGSFWVARAGAVNDEPKKSQNKFEVWLNSLEKFKARLMAMDVGDEIDMVGGGRAEQQYCHQYAHRTGKRFVTRTSRRTGAIKIIRTE